MQTYDEWLRVGRVPAAGERAQHYRTNEARTVGLALFREDQTVPIGMREAANPDADIVITREEWQAAKKKAKEPGPAVRVHQTSSGLAVWVGSNKKLIAFLKENGWKFDRSSHRWRIATDLTLEEFVETWTEVGCRVMVEYNPLDALPVPPGATPLQIPVAH